MSKTILLPMILIFGVLLALLFNQLPLYIRNPYSNYIAPLIVIFFIFALYLALKGR